MFWAPRRSTSDGCSMVGRGRGLAERLGIYMLGLRIQAGMEGSHKVGRQRGRLVVDRSRCSGPAHVRTFIPQPNSASARGFTSRPWPSPQCDASVVPHPPSPLLIRGSLV